MILPNIVLTNHACARRHVAEHQATRVLSILDPGETPPHFGVDHLALHFHDVACFGGPHWIEPPMGGHVDKIIQFAKSLGPDDRCVVFCHAGISRSPAAILIIVATLTKSAQAAAAALRDIDPAGLCDPNSRMISMGDRQLRLRGALVAEVAQMAVKRPAVSPHQIW